MDLQLKDNVVVVTGGASGIGLAIVRSFVSEGARVAVVDRDAGACESLVSNHGLSSDAVSTFVADLADPVACERVTGEILQTYGSVDVLVNNAGVNDGVTLDNDPADFMASLQLNVGSAFCMVRGLAAALKASGGSIVNIGSKVGATGQGGTSGYVASKGGLHALTREWALEMADDGVRVNAVIPAEVMTPMYERWLAGMVDGDGVRAQIENSIPLGRRMTSEDEIAAMVVFLASSVSSHTTGQLIHVDGGYRHLDRRCTLD